MACKLVNTIRRNIFSYDDVVNSVYVDEEVSVSLNTELYKCEKLKFYDPLHKPISTGDLKSSLKNPEV